MYAFSKEVFLWGALDRSCFQAADSGNYLIQFPADRRYDIF
jgi:hypothetical protein